MIRKLRFKFWYFIFWLSLRKAQKVLKCEDIGWCGNRVWSIRDIGDKFEVKVIWRDKRRSNWYSRTELFEMLREVRKHKAIQGYQIREPLAVELS